MLSLRKRGRLWHVRGTVRVGRETRVVKEHSTGCDRRSDAEAYKSKLELQVRSEILDGPAGRAKSVTFADAGLLYLNRPGGLHPMDVWRVGEFNEVFGDEPLSRMLDAWSSFKAKRCAGLAPATVDRFRATLQAALNHAAAELGIAVPKLPKVPFKNIRVRYLTEDEEIRLLAAYAKHVRPIMLTLCLQGCRTQEALQLEWRHVNLIKRTLFFPRTKTGEPRTVAMHRRVWWAVARLWIARGRPTGGHVFLNRLGRPYADTRDYALPGGNPLRKAHETACARAKIEDFRVHDWRHHWASWCVMSGIDLETIRRMGGWKSLRMLERYAAVSVDHMADAMDRLARKRA